MDGRGKYLGPTDLTQSQSTETEHLEDGVPAEPNWLTAVRAAQEKQALDIKVLDLTEVTTFTDYFVICSGTNSKQNQAIGDEILRVMKLRGERPISAEGYETADWILLDFADFLVHIFSTKGREYYDLERLWKQAKTVEIPAE